MYVTTHLPDGTRDVYRLPAEVSPLTHSWALVITGRRELGHLVGAGWWVWRHTATQEHARELAVDLERTCKVERAVVLPTTADEHGPVWTAIGFWDADEIHLLAVLPGTHDHIAADPYGGNKDWYAQVNAGNAQRAILEAYRAVDEAEVTALEPRTDT